MTPYLQLSKRERQAMDILYREGRASAARIREQMKDAPSYSAVRALLRVLEEKGCVRHEEKDLRYVYVPEVPRDEVKDSTLRHLIRTFFGGSTEAAVATLIAGDELSAAELDRLERLIALRKKEKP